MPEYSWWNTDWLHRRTITIQHEKVVDDLEDFPIRIYLNDSDAAASDIFTSSQNDLDDIAFTDYTGNVQLAHEIEDYITGGTNDVANIWLRSNVWDGNDTIIYMYYGNEGASNQENIGDVWTNYEMVHHMNGANAGGCDDSTDNNHDVTSSDGTPAYQEFENIGYSIRFAGASDYLSIPDDDDLSFGSDVAFTISAWVNYDADTGNIIMAKYGTKNEYFFYIAGGGGYPCLEFYDTNGKNVNRKTSDNIATDTWKYLTIGYNGNTLATGIYPHIDGSINLGSGYDAGYSSMTASDGALYIGKTFWGDNDFFNGHLDELRIANTNLSNNYIETDYNTMNSPSTFYEIGSKENSTIPNVKPEISNPDPANESTSIELQPTLSIDVSDNEGDDINITWYSNSSGSWQIFATDSSVGNGTYSQTNTNFTGYSTTYYWNVSVNDGEDYNSSDIFHLTTLANSNPVISNPDPANESTDENLNVNLQITVNDVDDTRQNMNITWYWGTDASCPNFLGHNLSVSNGTYYMPDGNNFTTHDTTYYWQVIVDDGFSGGDNEIFHFTTLANSNPTITGENPSNDTIGLLPLQTVNITVTDVEGDAMDITWQSNYSGSYVTYQTNSSVGNGSYSWYFSGCTEYNTFYYWRVFVDDGTTNVSDTFFFKTISKPDAPSSVDTTVDDRDTIIISWTNDGSNNTIVEFSFSNLTGDTYGSNTEIYNGTDTSFYHSGISYNTQYFYKVYSYGSTVDLYSINNVTLDSTTSNNERPATSNANPTNNSEKNALSLTWQVDINDAEGDTFNYTLTCNGTTNSGNNVGNGTYNVSISNLELETIYTVFVNVSDGYGITNNTFNFKTITTYDPEPPTSFTSSSISTSEIDLSWVTGVNATNTVVERNNVATWARGAGTEIYNGTDTSYSDTGLSTSTQYYYRAWGYNDLINIVFNETNVTTNDYTLPQAPLNGSVTVSGDNLLLDWDAATGADSYVVVQKSNSYATSVSDGTVIYNNTFTNHTKLNYNSSDYLNIFSYNDTSKYYSVNTDLQWGLLIIYVYREDKPHIQIGNYTIFINNPTTGETYYNTSQNNAFSIGIDEIPQGNDITIQVTKQGYKTRSIVQDLNINNRYNISIFLPPDSEGSPSSEQGEDWYVEPENNENTLKQTTKSVSNHSNDLDITLDCIPDEIILVEGYNESLYGHWFTIPEDKYSYSGYVVTIDNSILDANTTTCRVSYYCEVENSYAEHYIILVKDETGSGISDVKIDIKRYINTTETYITVVSGYTDTNGQLEVDLMTNVQYVVNLTESSGGYVNISETWMPPEITYSQDAIKTYILEYAEIQPQPDTNPAECININAEISNTTLYVNFSNSCNYYIDDIQVYVYMSNLSNDITSLFATNTSTDNTFFNFEIYNINNSNTYTIVIFYNNSKWGMQKLTIFIKGTDVISPDTDAEEIDDMFDLLFGYNPFGWHNILMLFVFVAAMFYADNRDIGKVLIFIGGLFLFLSVYVGLQSSIATVAGGVLPALFIIVGIIKLWIDSNK